ncbi:hypothetical protein H7H73_06530 [Mycobacterium rufum]|uniref:Uncharacterized protein n=1 Tax=Mycolicibacterium rufum TaxID=318424 RepID=A0A9X2XV09_9MYCO|nr:hypothetical protein [Mycolicibacterium rufum]
MSAAVVAVVAAGVLIADSGEAADTTAAPTTAPSSRPGCRPDRPPPSARTPRHRHLPHPPQRRHRRGR